MLIRWCIPRTISDVGRYKHAALPLLVVPSSSHTVVAALSILQTCEVLPSIIQNSSTSCSGWTMSVLEILTRSVRLRMCQVYELVLWVCSVSY